MNKRASKLGEAKAKKIEENKTSCRRGKRHKRHTEDILENQMKGKRKNKEAKDKRRTSRYRRDVKEKS